MTSDKPSISRLVDICVKSGIKDIVFSPGSRNAPLIISFVESQKFNCYCIPDERVAAFFALGMSIQSTNTTVLCCTSGSAALNYAPAISEAYYQGIPLLVLTADRPEEVIEHGMGQCIRQKNVYHNYVKAEFQLIQEANIEVTIKQNDLIVQNAIQISQQTFKGPVHINVPLEEPLYGTIDKHAFPPVDYIKNDVTSFALSGQKTAELLNIWNSASRKIVLVGLQHRNQEQEELLQQLINDHSIILLTETCSNVYVDNSIQCIDRVISGFGMHEIDYQADLLITFGGPVISKMIKAFFRKNKAAHHWDIRPDSAKDTFDCLTEHLTVQPENLLKLFKENPSQNSTEFQKRWLDLNHEAKQRHAQYLQNVPWSDFKAFQVILSNIPARSVLHMSNSTVVRYVQLFDQNKYLTYHANRGVSGIDGCSSTAMGYALNSANDNVLITGDMAFFYDSNAFWHNHHPENFKIILINNSGGGIFRIIPGPSSTNQLETYFETQQNMNARSLAELYDLEYDSVSSAEEMQSTIAPFFAKKSKRIKILEVFTPKENNAQVLKEYFEFVHSI